VKILILGATGTVGSHVADEAILRGHEVIARGRDSVRATDADSVARAAAGQDTVVSAAFDHANPETLLEIIAALLTGLERAGVRRLIVVGGAGTLEAERGRLVLDLDDFNPAYRAEAQAHLDALGILRTAQTPVEWTVITPPRRFDDSGRTGSYRTGEDELLLDEAGLSRISLEDFAVALLDETEKPRHVRARFSVAY
jgi:putative NADH-flavin reductase